MGRAILELAGDPARRRRLAAAGQAAVLARHDASQLVQRVTRLYEELLREEFGTDNPESVGAGCA
jgi:hypothetical protein